MVLLLLKKRDFDLKSDLLFFLRLNSDFESIHFESKDILVVNSQINLCYCFYALIFKDKFDFSQLSLEKLVVVPYLALQSASLLNHVYFIV